MKGFSDKEIVGVVVSVPITNYVAFFFKPAARLTIRDQD
jgi:hypothetical protein